MTIQHGNHTYESIEEGGQLVGLRRFDSKHKIWVELRFDEQASQRLEEDFVQMLTDEYISRETS